MNPFDDENPVGTYRSQWGVVVNVLRVVSIAEGQWEYGDDPTMGEVRLEPQGVGGWTGSILWPVLNENLPQFHIGQRYIIEGRVE